MYEKDGRKYFVFDSHLHFWDASPANWKPGAEEYAKGWIECFHAYQGLGPADTHWTLEHFQKYSADDFEKDVFQNGGVDKAVLQSTYLKEWYTNGFNVRALIAVAVGVIPVLPGFLNAATTEGGIVADPGFFDEIYKYGVFVAFGLSAVSYVALMRAAEAPAREPARAMAE